MINFDLNRLLYPTLYRLLNNSVKWDWSKDCEAGFEKCKKLLFKDNGLMNYDTNLEIVVTDSFSYGVGCVIAHVLLDGSERLIDYFLRVLTKSEVRYR